MDSVISKKLSVPTVHPVGSIERLVSPSGFSRIYESAFIGIGQVARRPLPKSKYVNSPFGFLSPSFFPSAITPGAYLNWIAKLSRPKGVHMSNAEYLRGLELLNREFSPYVVGGLTPLDEVLHYVDWDKSPGWPYVNMGCSTKREAWAKFPDEITKRVESLVRGEHVESVFIATVKDELLPAGKNPRIFLPAPFHHHLACAVLFKKACDSLNATCHRHSSAIGANVFGRGLERLLRSLDSLPFAYDADQSGCDTSWKDSEPERDFMKNGLPFDCHSGVDMVFNLAMCPKVIVGDRILQLELNPSGWYLTTVVNTLMTYRTIAAAYLDLSPTPATIDDMRSHLKQINGGDDLGYSTDAPWFDIVSLAHEVARRGMYLESDVLTPRRALDLTFYSHTLRPRFVGNDNRLVFVACGRLGKILSAFSYLKKSEGVINWQRNAARVVGLMFNLWPYKVEYEIMYPYLYHLVHHFFIMGGSNLTTEWSGIFRSIPTDNIMLSLRNGNAHETGFIFSQSRDFGSSLQIKRSFQSALKSSLLCPIVIDTNTITMSANAQNRRIDQILDKLEKRNGLTEDGRAWLVSSCDPFHDSDIALAGYPDVNTSATIVQLVKKQLQIVPPAGLPAGANWDASMVLFPKLQNLALQGFNSIDAVGNQQFEQTTPTTIPRVGGFVCAAGAQGAALWPSAIVPQIPPASLVQYTATDAATFINGDCRIIGMGFEVVNTTANINKQGQVTVWRMPTRSSPDVIWGTNADDPATLVPYNYMSSRFPPGVISDAQLLFGSRSWAAEEGVYIVSRQNSDENPLLAPDFIPDAYNCFDSANGNNSSIYTFGVLRQGTKQADIHAPYDLSGCQFTGLSNATTLTVNVRWLIERSPAPTESDLVVLATPSACYDPLALELYCHCLSSMPPGVMLKENGLGDWFRKALDGVAKFAPTIGTALGSVGVPGAELIGRVVSKGASMGSQVIKNKQDKAKSIAFQKKQALVGSASTTQVKKNHN